MTELLVRGNTQAQIVSLMAADDAMHNPVTTAPWSKDTIYKDVKLARERWQEQTRLHYDIHVSRILGQIRAVRIEAWNQEDLGTVLKTLDQEVKLLGLDKVTKSDLDWKKELREAGVDPNRTFEDLVQSTYERLEASREE